MAASHHAWSSVNTRKGAASKTSSEMHVVGATRAQEACALCAERTCHIGIAAREGFKQGEQVLFDATDGPAAMSRFAQEGCASTGRMSALLTLDVCLRGSDRQPGGVLN